MDDNEELARQAACKAMNFILGGMTKDSDDISYTLGRLDSDLYWIAQNEHNHIIIVSIYIYGYMMRQFCDELKAEISNKQEIKNDEKSYRDCPVYIGGFIIEFKIV